MTTVTVLQSQTPQEQPVPGCRHRSAPCAAGGVLCLALYTLLVLHVNIPHLPGSGMMIPQSVLAWMLAAVLLLLAAPVSRQALSAALRPTPFMTLCLAGALILTLPLLYAPQTWRYLAELRVAGLWGGLLLMVATRALFTTPSLRRTVLVLMLAGCVLEALTGIVQALHPQSLPFWLTTPGTGRATGVFRQPNVMASLTGTGVILAWCLLNQTACRAAQVAMLAATAVLAFCLPLTQSTQTWLTLALAAALVCLPLFRTPGRVRLMRLWLCVLVAGVLAGLLAWHGQHGDLVDHAYGRYGRLQMWQNCLWLIAHRPWSGWGYGRFDVAYVHAWQASGNIPVIDLAYTTHPHNEVLYWLTEGGMVAGAGLLLILAAGISLVRRSLQARRDPRTQAAGMQALTMALCTLPVLMHTQLEWPLYLSAWHYLMVVMLLAMADGTLQQAKALPAAGDNARTTDHAAATHRRIPALPARAVLLCAGILTLWWMVTGLMVGLQLTQAALPGGLTTSRLQALEAARTHNPWVLKEEVWRTEAVAQANRAYRTGDLSQLIPVIGFEEQYLLRHPDPDITANLIKHLRLTGQTARAQRVMAQGHALAPWDVRFSDDATLPEGAQPQSTPQQDHEHEQSEQNEQHAGPRDPQTQTVRNAS